jgi:hypothetical protein
MGLLKEQRLLTDLENNKNLKVISIQTTNENFNHRFDCISNFWRALKNGLYSINNRTNREVMRGLTGVYFSLEMVDEMQIIIIYDSSIKSLNQLDTSVRLMKLLGFDIKITYGTFEEYKPVIKQMFGIRRKIQPFGEYYFKK